MDKKQGIRWKECGGAALHGERSGERGMALVAEVLLDAVCALLFLCATRVMLNDVFEWGLFSARATTAIGVAAIGVSYVMGYTLTARETLGKKIRWGILGAGILVFLYWLNLGGNREEILLGSRGIVEKFIGHWNSYYGTSIMTSSFVVPGEYAAKALNYWLLMMFFVLLWLAKTFKKKLIMAVPPIVVFILELMVGYSAGEKGIFMMVVGLLLANTSVWKDKRAKVQYKVNNSVLDTVCWFSWIIVGVVVVCGLSLVKVAGTPSADKIVHSASHIRDWFDELFSDVPKGAGDGGENGSNSTGDLGYTQELSNSTPKYKYIPVFTVNLDSSPLGTLYFKGMYADVYEEGTWSQDSDAFSSLLERTGMNSPQLSALISFREVDHLLDNYKASSLTESIYGKRMQIEFERSGGQSIYLPYFAEINHGLISAKGDSYYYRTGAISELNFTVWYYENQYQDRLDMLSASTVVADWERQYESYVLEHYLDVPEELVAVREIAAQLSTGTLIGGYSVNDLRLYHAGQVAGWMSENTEYSLELPELPDGSDPIEFFLVDSRTGYCMHYASASVMILRAMGIPARLATGYVTGTNSFEALEIGGYTATVLDSQAHAWVEIYLEGIGWVPYEVTKGYQGLLPDFNPNDDPTGDTDNTGDPDELTTSGEDQPDRPDRTTEDHPDVSSKESESTDSGGNGGGFIGGIGKNLRPILIVLGISLVVIVVIYVVLRIRHEYRQQLMRQIRRKHTSHAIRIMNRRIYRKLRLTGKVVKLNLRDDGYEDILKKTYTDIPKEDWERYMAIAKKAAFSNQEFSAEEVRFFYEIYRKVKPHS